MPGFAGSRQAGPPLQPQLDTPVKPSQLSERAETLHVGCEVKAVRHSSAAPGYVVKSSLDICIANRRWMVDGVKAQENEAVSI